MKKLLAIAFTLLLGASLSFAQATGGSADKGAGDKSTTPPAKTTSSKKSHSHKGGKKAKKKAPAADSAPAPK